MAIHSNAAFNLPPTLLHIIFIRISSECSCGLSYSHFATKILISSVRVPYSVGVVFLHLVRMYASVPLRKNLKEIGLSFMNVCFVSSCTRYADRNPSAYPIYQ
jgi:hypothetical protein